MLDLGITGRKAIVCAASKGLGRACAMALGRAGVELVITARTAETLEADRRRNPPGDRRQGDRRRRRHHDRGRPPGGARRLPRTRTSWSTIAGGPPHGDFREWAVEDWQKAVNANMLTPIMLIKATVDGMCAAQIRAHRQHHLGLGEVADPQSRA